MGFLTAIIDALAGFVRRNPLTVLLIVILAIGAPTLLKGIALFFLYVVLGIVLLVVVLLLLFRWRIYKMQQQMGEQFKGFGQQGARRPSDGASAHREGEVKVYTTSETPGKRVSSDVGDYVEFEETKEKDA